MGKYSRQRELIRNAVMENKVHPTADYIYNLLKEENPGLSLGTVYRNLNLLAQEGSIQKIKLAEGPDRFDGQVSEHLHMACACCGALVDLPSECRGEMTALDREISRKTGHEITSYSLMFFGICRDCKAKKS